MAMESMVIFHVQRASLWRQATLITGCAFATLICAIAFIAIVAPYSRYLGSAYLGGMAWMLVVAILTLGGIGNFVATQKNLAQSPDYIPTLNVLYTGIVISMLWFTASIALVAGPAMTVCYYSSYDDTFGGLCAAVALADVFAWLSFIGSVLFSLTTYGLGSRSGIWGGGVQQNVHMGAVPALQHPGQVYGQQPYYGGGGPGPQGPYPQPPLGAYSPAPTPQQPPPPMHQSYSPQISLQQPYTPPANLQQPYTPQATPQQPYTPQATPQQPYSPQATPQQPYSPQATPQQPYSSQVNPQQPHSPQANPQQQPYSQQQQPYGQNQSPQTHLYHESKPETP